MEIDVESTDTTPNSAAAPWHQILSCTERHSEPTEADRKRKEATSSSTVLKGILRQRSEHSSCVPSQRSSHGQKRAVKFILEDKAENGRKWYGKKLRYLALDLDKWDSLPYPSRRSFNKQKTRQTKRLKLCQHNNSRKNEHSAGFSCADIEAETLKISSRYQKGTEDTDCMVPKEMPDVTPIGKFHFVERWLQLSSHDVQSILPFVRPTQVSNESHLIWPAASMVMSDTTPIPSVNQCTSQDVFLPVVSHYMSQNDPNSAASHCLAQRVSVPIVSHCLTQGLPQIGTHLAQTPENCCNMASSSPGFTPSLVSLSNNFTGLSLKTAMSRRQD